MTSDVCPSRQAAAPVVARRPLAAVICDVNQSGEFMTGAPFPVPEKASVGAQWCARTRT